MIFETFVTSLEYSPATCSMRRKALCEISFNNSVWIDTEEIVWPLTFSNSYKKNRGEPDKANHGTRFN